MTKIARPVGSPVLTLPPGTVPDLRPLHGRHSGLEALDADTQGETLWGAKLLDEAGELSAYISTEPMS